MLAVDPSNPLSSDDPYAWDRLIDSLGPASMIAALACRMDAPTRARFPPEDLWQETLLLAWRARGEVSWRGLTSFRRWLLQIGQNCLRTWIEQDGAQKRGGGVRPVSLDASSQGSLYAGPLATTTPSRALSDAEEARLVQETLESLPEELRLVVQLRLLDGLRIDEVAAQLGVGEGAVRHRLRKGAELFEYRMRARRSSRAPRNDGERPRDPRGAAPWGDAPDA